MHGANIEAHRVQKLKRIRFFHAGRVAVPVFREIDFAGIGCEAAKDIPAIDSKPRIGASDEGL